MPQPPNTALRIAVPIVLLAGGVLVAWSIFRNTGGGTTPGASPATPTVPAPATPPTGGPPTAPTAPANGGPPPIGPAPPAPGAPAPNFVAEFFPAPPGTPTPAYAPLGSALDPAVNDFELRLEFSHLGAGIESLRLANQYETVANKDHERLQQFYPLPANSRLGIASMSALGVDINGVFVKLSTDPVKAGSYWQQDPKDPGLFTARILDAGGAAVATITRHYRLTPGSYEILVEQTLTNLADKPITAIWHQLGPVDLPIGVLRYGGDRRRVRFGYLLPKSVDPSQSYVQSSGSGLFSSIPGLYAHAEAVGKDPKADKVLWPTLQTTSACYTLTWAGTANRYFAVVVQPALDPTDPNASKAFSLVASVDRLVWDDGLRQPGSTAVALRLTTVPLTAEPGKSADLSMGVYAGPMSPKYMDPATEPRAAAVHLDQIVIYTFGGPCAFCTFQPLTHFLRWYLGILHDYVLRDWGLAIIVLVLCVRTLLHPVTKFSQTSMMRFGKQMQGLAPKQKKLQEKFKADPKKLREEMARLMREENINYAGALGCLPMFLQTPIWIALFAMLYFTFELRHEPAFFGLFPSLGRLITGRPWTFLADLAEPDNFINFRSLFGLNSIQVPLLSNFMGPVEGINILPLILGVVFFIQQKYLSPPTAATLTPEQQQQQKMMKIMSVVMFPVFMYNVPSGLALYTMTNSILGIFESRYIRRHFEQVEALRTAQPRPLPSRTVSERAGPERPGFFARLQQRIEAAQKEAQRRRSMEAKRRPKK